MTLATDLKSLARSVRAIPGQMGLRPHRVEVIASTWDGPHTGDGYRFDEVTPITEADGQPPKVRWLTDEEVVAGDISIGTVEIGPITAEFTGGGATLDEIRSASLTTGGARFLRIVGPKHPNGAIYRIAEVRADRAIHYKLRAYPVESQTA